MQQHDQQAGQQQPHHGDGHIDPKAPHIVHQAELELAGFLIRRPAFGHKADEQHEKAGDAEGPAEGALPFHRPFLLLIEAGHGRQHQHEHQHIIPAGVVHPVE